MLEIQYQVIEIVAIGLACALLGALLIGLLILIGRSAVRPVLRVSQALEQVAQGNLNIRLPETGRDEFTLLAQRFNEMTTGLREKLQLYQYVSQGTIQAVRRSVAAGDDQQHAGQRIDLSLFFSDIRGFTSFSESRDPADIVATLNKILSIQAEIITRFGGDIDKFVGDEVMAVFATPQLATEAAIAIQRELGKRRAEIADLHVGIGIHHGTVVQGDVGSTNHKDFTVIGDTVNTAARLQAVSKADEILLSEAAAQQLKGPHDFSLVSHGTLELKGKNIRIKSYRVD